MSIVDIPSVTAKLTKDISDNIRSTSQSHDKLGGIKAKIDPTMQGFAGSLDTTSLACGDHIEARDEQIRKYLEENPDLSPEHQAAIKDEVTKALPMNKYSDLKDLFGSRKKAAAAKVGTFIKAHPILANVGAYGLAGVGALGVISR